MEEDKAEPLIARALELADESGSIVARASAAQSKGDLHRVRGQYEEAEGWLTKALDLYRETASVSEIAWTSRQLAQVAWETGNPAKAEKLFRESIRLLAPMKERGTLCESQRLLAQLLLAEGRIDEAEKFALAARETVSAEDVTSRATTRVALAQVRAAQGRYEEAETLFAEAAEIIGSSEHCRILLDILPPYAEFLRGLEREAEAVELEARLAERVAGRSVELLSNRLVRRRVGRFGDHGRGPVEVAKRFAERRDAQRPLAVGKMLRLVAVRVRDVGEVDVERRVGREHRVCAGKDLREGRRLREPAVRDRVQMCEVEHRSNPAADAPRSRRRRLRSPARARGP